MNINNFFAGSVAELENVTIVPGAKLYFLGHNSYYGVFVKSVDNGKFIVTDHENDYDVKAICEMESDELSNKMLFQFVKNGQVHSIIIYEI